jgi:hypothetical protein
MIEYVKAIECATCKALHRPEDATYITISVDIDYAGAKSGSFCKKFSCMQWLIKEIAIDAVQKQDINIGALQLGSTPYTVPSVKPHNPNFPDNYRVTFTDYSL